ncbi:MAG TPA: extracellular solute-binding protein [Candidatus Sphingobacterium stercoripullorum]|nr:extracellular solute-binding protein [Candidatus Sphingobacterium stercoripullorum]
METKKSLILPRRSFLRKSAGVGLGVFASSLPSFGFAQPRGELVVSNWGGDWNSNVMKALETPALEQNGITVRRDLASAPARKSKLLAERNLPRGTVDIAHLTDADAYELEMQGVLEEIDYDRIPNAKNLISMGGERNKYFVPWVFSGFEMIYNPEKVEKPTSFADLMNPEYKGKVGLIDQVYFNYLYAFSLVAGGDLSDISGAFPLLLELKKQVEPKVYPSHQQLAAAMQAEEVWISANYKARAAQWEADDLPIRGAYPKEGGVAIQFGVVIPKKAPNKDLAYHYINEMLTPKAAEVLAELTYYAPAIDDVNLPAEVAQQIQFSPEQQEQLHVVDFSYAAKNQPEWLEWWNKNIKV